MKKLMMIAAMMLMSMGAFAQNEVNIEAHGWSEPGNND